MINRLIKETLNLSSGVITQY